MVTAHVNEQIFIVVFGHILMTSVSLEFVAIHCYIFFNSTIGFTFPKKQSIHLNIFVIFYQNKNYNPVLEFVYIGVLLGLVCLIICFLIFTGGISAYQGGDLQINSINNECLNRNKKIFLGLCGTHMEHSFGKNSVFFFILFQWQVGDDWKGRKFII